MATTARFSGRVARRRGGLRVLALVLLSLGAAPVLLFQALLALPASWLEEVVARGSGDRVHLHRASGRVGDGGGELWVRDAFRREWLPWLPIAWRVESVWRSPAGDWAPALRLWTSRGDWRFGADGLHVSGLALTLPPGLLLDGLSHPLARAHWRGDVVVGGEALFCPRQGARLVWFGCQGTLSVRWLGAASSILPLPELGDYRATVRANGRGAKVEVATERGVVDIAGDVDAGAEGSRYRFTIRGERAMIGGLDNITGYGIQKLPGGSEFRLEGRF